MNNNSSSAWVWIAAGAAVLLLLGGGGVAVYRQYKQRGIRNNNPGNLEVPESERKGGKVANAWKGKVPWAQNSDGRFEQFRDTDGVPGHIWGLRAMFIDLKGDVEKRGQDTIRKLITSYAPAHENNTAAYIAAVAKALDISPDRKLERAHYPVLMAAIVRHENGVQPYPTNDIARAIALA